MMTENAIRALAELLELRDEIDERTERRRLMISAAAQAGAGATAIAAATGLSRSMIQRMIGPSR